MFIVLIMPAIAMADPLDTATLFYKRGDYKAALEYLQPMANQGNASAQTMLAYMYSAGLGAERNYSESVSWYRKAAEQHNSNAQLNLGELYFHGEGVKQDYPEALKWFKLAAEQDDKTAQAALAGMYTKGLGTEKDKAEAYFWLLLAARSGNISYVAALKIMELSPDTELPPDKAAIAKARAAAWKPMAGVTIKDPRE